MFLVMRARTINGYYQGQVRWNQWSLVRRLAERTNANVGANDELPSEVVNVPGSVLPC